jgi:outer membrane immunogenic protein
MAMNISCDGGLGQSPNRMDTNGYALVVAGILTSVTVLTGLQAQGAELWVPPFEPPPLYNWTGLYVGAEAGYAELQGDIVALVNGRTVFQQQSKDGFTGMALAGYNWQIPFYWWNCYTMVVGMETDIGGATGNSTRRVSIGPETFDLSENAPWLTTLRGRFGIPFGVLGQWLVYGTAGVGFTRINSTAITYGPFYDSLNGSSGRAVWTAGGGLEYGFSRFWSWKVDYTYVETGGVTNVTPTAPGGVQLSTGRTSVQSVRTGINFHF